MMSRTLLTLTAAAAVTTLSLSACGSSDSSGGSSSAEPRYGVLTKEMRQFYPDGGWTVALAKQASNSVCDDLDSYSYDAVVKNRTSALNGDRPQAQEFVIASAKYVCPDHMSDIPGSHRNDVPDM